MTQIMQARRKEILQLQRGDDGETQRVLAPWAFQVLYAKPKPSLSMAKKTHATAQMILRGMVVGAPANCLLDTGATDSFRSEEFLKCVNVAPQALKETEVELATDEVTKAIGLVKLRTVFKNLPCNHSYYAVPKIAGGCDLL
jgi:Retroviral aspartyl protease